MEVTVQQVTTDEDLEAVLRIRDRVFLREMGIRLAPKVASENGHVVHLIARGGPNREPVGSLSVIDTSESDQLHEGFGLKFEARSRVARYTHLAVLKPYRGMNVPLAIMIEAHRCVIVPRQFEYTWLLFDVERAANSFLSRRLGFTPMPETFVSKYGCRCPLVRDERTLRSAQFIARAESYLAQRQSLNAPIDAPRARYAPGA
jgi:hypothetical protein